LEKKQGEIELLDKIKRTSLWYAIRKIYRAFVKRKIIKYDGKQLTPVIQSKIQEIIKKNHAIYFRSEMAAKKLADNWQGVLNRSENICFIEKAIPIAFCSNNSFAPYMAVMLQSLLDNSNPQRKYHFIIFEPDFSDMTKSYLTEQVSKFTYCYIDFINTKNALDEIPFSLSKSHFTTDIFSRFFIPYWLDKYPKVIYCDGDMRAMVDIAELYDMDMQGYCMGATINNLINEILHTKKYSPLISVAVFSLLENWSYYINSGLLVFNTNKFKEKITYQDLFKFIIYYTNRYRKTYDDQDVLSLFVKDDYFVLPPEWNYCWSSSSADGNKEYFRESKSNTKIIHFTGKIKPWKNFPEIVDNPDAIAYRDYARNIPLFNVT